jgi:hypothetical protein
VAHHGNVCLTGAIDVPARIVFAGREGPPVNSVRDKGDE